MKTPSNARAGHNAAIPTGQRAAGSRPPAAKAIEHRSARRKIREQLRGLDRPLSWENEVFA